MPQLRFDPHKIFANKVSNNDQHVQFYREFRTEGDVKTRVSSLLNSDSRTNTKSVKSMRLLARRNTFRIAGFMVSVMGVVALLTWKNMQDNADVITMATNMADLTVSNPSMKSSMQEMREAATATASAKATKGVSM
eukprot:GDKH01008344.1.p1 GENE.GDKH01008344.1~~GDKH01008344.1.p1  ORF type:complete len:136 (+),score=17.15 GDKH01008344.1:199-606(+)